MSCSSPKNLPTQESKDQSETHVCKESIINFCQCIMQGLLDDDTAEEIIDNKCNNKLSDFIHCVEANEDYYDKVVAKI